MKTKFTKEMVGKRFFINEGFLINEDYYLIDKYYEAKLLEMTEDEKQVKLELLGGIIWQNNYDRRTIKELEEM